MAGPIVTLTTDFGTADTFAATLKAVILGINPQATVVDITHDVPPQDIQAGAFLFSTAYPYFPDSTIHVLVVDPGVGTGRRPLLVVGPSASFVGPDNGLLSYVLAGEQPPEAPPEPFAIRETLLPPGWKAYHLTNQQYWHLPISSTFHGRDIFAPVAAYLSSGVSPSALGHAIDRVIAFAVPRPFEAKDGKLVGTVLQVDRFGNLITNVKASEFFSANADIVIDIAGHRVQGLASSYQEGVPLLAIIGSHGYLEIGARNASAASILGLGPGDEVHVGLM